MMAQRSIWLAYVTHLETVSLCKEAWEQRDFCLDQIGAAPKYTCSQCHLPTLYCRDLQGRAGGCQRVPVKAEQQPKIKQ